MSNKANSTENEMKEKTTSFHIFYHNHEKKIHYLAAVAYRTGGLLSENPFNINDQPLEHQIYIDGFLAEKKYWDKQA